MLIESFDNNLGTIIYSENKFDFLTNFTKISRNEPDVQEHVDFKEVSTYIGKPVKKNLILYRLLTNDENLDPFSTKLGYFIKLANKIEVVYFDPIFIVKDINNLKLTIDDEDFRFIIQQVGFRTKTLTEDTAIYEESFSIDMSQEEARNQNDSIFAESMIALKRSSRKKISVSNSDAEVNAFQNIVTETNKLDKQFYHLDGIKTKHNTTYVEENNASDTKIENNDFFSRVKLKKDRKNYRSNALKMFR